MSYKLSLGGKALNSSLNIYYDAYVEDQNTNVSISAGKKVKWATLDSTNSHNSFTFTLDDYDLVIPNDGYTYFLTAELDHSRNQNYYEYSYMFQFKDTEDPSNPLGFPGYRFGPLNRQLGQYSGDDPLDLISDDGSRVMLKGPKTINLVITDVNGDPPIIVSNPSNTSYSSWVTRARMLVWRI